MIRSCRGWLAIEGSGDVEKRQAIFDEMHACLTERRINDCHVAGECSRMVGCCPLGAGMTSCLQHHHRRSHHDSRCCLEEPAAAGDRF
jgi:hypothetical protein